MGERLGWVVYSTIMMVVFLWIGINMGIGASLGHGSTKACEMMRWTILDCSYEFNPKIPG